MLCFVTDTQAMIKFLQGKFVINDAIQQAFFDAENGLVIIYVPTVVLFEIGYLYEKRRINISLQDMQAFMNDNPNFKEQPLNMTILKQAFEINDIPELHDRLISGIARHYNCPLLTNDPAMVASKFVTVHA